MENDSLLFAMQDIGFTMRNTEAYACGYEFKPRSECRETIRKFIA
jgi:hypothetical protein